MHTHTRELRRSRTYEAMVTSFLPKTFSPETMDICLDHDFPAEERQCPGDVHAAHKISRSQIE